MGDRSVIVIGNGDDAELSTLVQQLRQRGRSVKPLHVGVPDGPPLIS